MSQMSTQSQDSSGVCFPLAKYSSYHGRDVKGTGKLPYKHVIHPDLKVHIRDVRSIDDQGNYATRVVLKVATGADVLFAADLGEILACYRRFNPSLGKENPVRVAVRAPAYLAMIYPTPDGNSQRFQLNLWNEADFEKVVTMFHDLGFQTTTSTPLSKVNPLITPRTDAPPAPPAPPSSMYSASSRAPSPASSVSRPASAMRSSPLSYEVSFGHPSTFKLPPIPELSNSDIHRQVSGLPFSKPYNTPFSTLPTPIVPRVETLKYGLDLNKHSSLHLAQMDKEASFERPSLPAPPAFELSQSSDIDHRQDLSLTKERLDLHRHTEQEETRQYTSSPFFSTNREALSGQRPFSTDPFSRLPQEADDDDIFTSPPTVMRPMSAPLDKGAMQDLLIPPKRTLPFLPPKNCISSTANLPPLPQPTTVARSESVIRPPILPGMTVDTPVKNPTSRRVAQRKAPVQPATAKPIIPAVEPELNDTGVLPEPLPTMSQGEVSPLAAKSASRRPASAAAVLETKATSTRKRAAPSHTASAAKRPKMVDQSTQTDLRPDRAAQTPENTRPPGFLISPPEDYLQAVDNFIATHRARPPPAELYNTPEYQDASQEERDILVNNFICENLQNPNFIQLCKDAANSWRRIGLGT